MLLLKKTLIYPGENPVSVLSRKCLKIVVLRNNRDIVETAEILAQNQPTNTERHIIWYKSYDDNELKNKFPGLPDNLSGILAFSLSTTNKVCEVISNWKDGDYVRMESIFENAELEENNCMI
jgi:hypothetical protein